MKHIKTDKVISLRHKDSLDTIVDFSKMDQCKFIHWLFSILKRYCNYDPKGPKETYMSKQLESILLEENLLLKHNTNLSNALVREYLVAFRNSREKFEEIERIAIFSPQFANIFKYADSYTDLAIEIITYVFRVDIAASWNWRNGWLNGIVKNKRYLDADLVFAKVVSLLDTEQEPHYAWNILKLLFDLGFHDKIINYILESEACNTTYHMLKYIDICVDWSDISEHINRNRTSIFELYLRLPADKTEARLGLLNGLAIYLPHEEDLAYWADLSPRKEYLLPCILYASAFPNFFSIMKQPKNKRYIDSMMLAIYVLSSWQGPFAVLESHDANQKERIHNIKTFAMNSGIFDSKEINMLISLT